VEKVKNGDVSSFRDRQAQMVQQQALQQGGALPLRQQFQGPTAYTAIASSSALTRPGHRHRTAGAPRR